LYRIEILPKVVSRSVVSSVQVDLFLEFVVATLDGCVVCCGDTDY
jgi:hypothetical protein